jgi:hypothetical protein
MPGILNWSLEGLRRFRVAKRISRGKAATHAVVTVRNETEHAKRLLLEHDTARDGAEV